MKILPLFIEPIPHVKIARCLEEAGPDSLALDRLYPVQPALESYAKANNVELLVSKSVPNDTHKLPKYVRNITDNMISLTVRNRDGSNPMTTNFVVHPYADTYSFEKSAQVKFKNSDGDEAVFKSTHVYQDNFIRAFFRTFENLTKQVKSLD